MYRQQLIGDYIEWMSGAVGCLTDEVSDMSPSEFCEANRYLPPSVTPLPGYFSYDVCPYHREIVDCLDVRSPIREVDVMKGSQICYTVGVLEAGILYYMGEASSVPCIFATADAELAQLRIDLYITPMIQQSGMAERIQSSDDGNKRKSGKTNKKIEWRGGGFLIPMGAQNANKMRSISAQVIFEDENDGWPLTVGRDGDSQKLIEDRAKSFPHTKKLMRGSTPLIEGTSKIARGYETGDKRKYFVPCRKCEEMQEFEWRGNKPDPETGKLYGLVWKEEKGGRLVPGSVRYKCKFCGHEHVNADKRWMLPRGEWRPTAIADKPTHRSYHINSMYSPAGMWRWEDVVGKWLAAWDTEAGRPRDLGLLQVFYNNELGRTFEVRGDRLRFVIVSQHRRTAYRYGEVPNHFAVEHCGSRVLALTCAVDVHKENLKVAVFGWTRGNNVFLVDYYTFEGETEGGDNPETWGKLQDLVENKEYTADDGAQYRIALTLVDAGYFTETVYTWCGQYSEGVYPIMGRDKPTKGSVVQEFAPYTTKFGTPAYGITVDLYKDRWGASLRRTWNGEGPQPKGHFNAPVDTTDKQIKELTAEKKIEKREKTTNKLLGYVWHRPNGAANELWDLLAYCSAALDMIAWDVCLNQLGMKFVSWEGFWNLAEEECLYYTLPMEDV